MVIGQCIPPANGFILEKISNTRAVLSGGIMDDGTDLTYNDNLYLLEISVKVVVS